MRTCGHCLDWPELGLKTVLWHAKLRFDATKNGEVYGNTVSFSFWIPGNQGFRVAETAARNMHAWHFCSIPPVNRHKHATTGAGLQFET